MDSLSQALLGSAVALVATRGKNPRRAIVVGAVLGTLPDLDVLIPSANDLDAMTKHRSWSHSWVMHILVSPALAWVLFKLQWYFANSPETTSWPWTTWLAICLLVLITHSGLDALTIYGTWLFWPFGAQPVMGGGTFIIDPLYTLPLLLSVIWIWRRPQNNKHMKVVTIGIVVSSLYLGFGLVTKHRIENTALGQLGNSGIVPQTLVATPTPFNTFLWRIIAIESDRFHEGFYRLLDGGRPIRFTTFDRGLSLIEKLDDQSAIEQFRQFNHEYFALSRDNNRILGQDLRMGAEPFYFFQFEFASVQEPTSGAPGATVATTPSAYPMKIEIIRLFGWLIKRLAYPDLPPLDSPRKLDPDQT